MGATTLRKLRQLEDENARLKRLVADLTLDKHNPNEVLEKSSELVTPALRYERIHIVVRREIAGGFIVL